MPEGDGILLNRMEKYLTRMVVLSLLLVVVAQSLMTADPIRFYMSWSERMEGQTLPVPVNASKAESPPATTAQVSSPDVLVTISVANNASLSKAKILVNGRERYTFSNSSVLMRLNAGDTIEVDASNYNFPIDFTITSGSANLSFPVKGEVYTANQSIVMIGKVIVK